MPQTSAVWMLFDERATGDAARRNPSADGILEVRSYWEDSFSVKVVNKCLYFIFEILLLCLDDSFAHSWHSLKQLHLYMLVVSKESKWVQVTNPHCSMANILTELDHVYRG